MSQKTFDLSMVYYEREDGTQALVKPRGDVLAFRHSITAERFVMQLMQASVNVPLPMTFLVRQEAVMVDDRFPISIVELCDRTDTDLRLIADEVVAKSLL